VTESLAGEAERSKGEKKRKAGFKSLSLDMSVGPARTGLMLPQISCNLKMRI